MMKINFIITTILALMSAAVFSDDFNYQSVEECANLMKTYALKAHELSEQHTTDTDNTYVNFLQMESFFWNISYSKGEGIFARNCYSDHKTRNCVATIYVTCGLTTQHPKLWTTTIAPLLEKEVKYLKNNQADQDIAPQAIPFMICSTTLPSDGAIVDWDHCKASH